ncbi:MAG: AAA family ATPase [Terracidiphilus sp.]
MPSRTVIDRSLEERLHRLQLRLEAPDEDTLAVKRVPADLRNFSKPRTNLLIKRMAEGRRCMVCVDDDLEYRGADQLLSRAFASGPTQQGWRILTFGGGLEGNLSEALDYAFSFLGAEQRDRDVDAPATAGGSLLQNWSTDLTRLSVASREKLTLFRDEEVEQVAACALGWQGRLPLIAGEPGTGKTNLANGVAQLLATHSRQVLAVNLGAVMAGTLFESERESALSQLLREAHEAGAVLVLEQAEWGLIGVSRGALLVRQALDEGVRLIATATPEHIPRFFVNPLGSRLEITKLQELCPGDTRSVLALLRPALEAHHGVQIDAEVEQAAVERAAALEGAMPEKAVKLLDSAAARASLNQSQSVGLIDIYIAASRMAQQA